MSEQIALKTARIALVGNPNSGKTTLFNALTGLHQKVGNYAGVTVEKVEGAFALDDQSFTCIDVPGLYSMIPMSEDEVVAVQAIQGSESEPKPDVLVCVVDATNLERNLYFFAQIAQQGVPVVIALTLVDLAAKSGAKVDLEALKEKVGVPVVPVVAAKRQGIGSLKHEIRQAVGREPLGLSALPAPTERYEWAEQITRQVLTIDESNPVRAKTDQIDKFLTHRIWGLGIFILVMALMFISIYELAGPLMDLIETGFGALQGMANDALRTNPTLASLVADGIIGGIGSVAVFLPQILILFAFIAVLEGSGYLARASFLMDRILGWCGLNGKAFIPLLSSYACAIPGIMAARIMPDPKSRLVTILVAPLMSCSARLPVYVLLIGAIVEPTFGPLVAGLTLFAMHVLGLLVAIVVMFFFNRRLLRGSRLPFLMEMPPYQWPQWKAVLRAVLERGKVFLQAAGTIIFAMSIVIWALLYFPRSEDQIPRFEQSYAQKLSAGTLRTTVEGSPIEFETYVEARRLEESALGRFGHFIQPVFAPAGFDWRLSTAIVAAFPAREVMVSSLGILFDLGGEVDEESGDLRTALQNATHSDGRKLLPAPTAFSVMVFFALCCQCMSTLAIIKRETNSWKWPVICFVYMTALAWIGAVAVYQLGMRLWGG